MSYCLFFFFSYFLEKGQRRLVFVLYVYKVCLFSFVSNLRFSNAHKILFLCSSVTCFEARVQDLLLFVSRVGKVENTILTQLWNLVNELTFLLN